MGSLFEKYKELRDYLSDGRDTCKVSPDKEEEILNEMDELWFNLTDEEHRLLDNGE